MSKLVYAVGDIHGDFLTFKKLLEDYDPNMHQLVMIGDLLDRGPLSKECLLLGKQLVEETGAVYLKGNHEELLLNFLGDPLNRFDHYIRNGGGETLESLLHLGALAEYSAVELSAMVRIYYPELILFLTNLPLYYEWEDYLFVHAGVDLSLADWRQTVPHDFVWIRQPFHDGKNQTGKRIVFGHTITPSLHGDNQATSLWLVDDKIGIDGGGIYGGTVHGVIFNQQGILQDYEIQSAIGSWTPHF